MERTLVILKPDCVRKKLVGKVINILEENKLNINNMKMQSLNESILKEHYYHLSDKPFFDEIIEYMTSGPVVTMVIEGESVIERTRNIVGHKDPEKANPNTIRGLYAESVGINVIHASDSPERALEEINRFF